MLRCKTVENRDDSNASEVGDRDGLCEGAGVHCEASAVEIDEDRVGMRRRIDWSDVADRDAGDCLGFDVDGIGGARGLPCTGLPGVCVKASLCECGCAVGIMTAERGLRLGTDGGWNRDDAS